MFTGAMYENNCERKVALLRVARSELRESGNAPLMQRAFDSLTGAETTAGQSFLQQAEALVAIAGKDIAWQAVGVRGEVNVVIQDAAREEIAVHMRWSFAYAHRRIEEARLILGPLELTRGALHEGTITVAHATAICTGVRKLSNIWECDSESRRDFETAARKLDEAGVKVAKTSTITRTRGAVEKKLEEIDGLHQRKRRSAASRDHDVIVLDQGEGQALLLARMGLIEAQACMAVINTRAKLLSGMGLDATVDRAGEPPDKAAPAGVFRSRALIAVLTGMPGRAASSNAAPGDFVPGSTECGSHSSLQANIDIVIDLASLLGLQESIGLVSSGVRAPVSAPSSDIRDLLAQIPDLTFRRMITDPHTNHLIDLGRQRYVPSKSLREFITARDQVCRFPGCERSARGGQIDHANPWSQGGKTDRENLGALCVRHHQLKTHGEWCITESAADGSTTWRTPSGRKYSIPPPELPHASSPLGPSPLGPSPVGPSAPPGLFEPPGRRRQQIPQQIPEQIPQPEPDPPF